VYVLTINVTAVNDHPSFVAGPPQNVTDESGPQAIAHWASGLSAGPPDEIGQKLHFELINNNPALFAAYPAIDATGMLTFEPKVNASGSAEISVWLADDGGTANGGVDRSDVQTFSIQISLALPWHNREKAEDVDGDGLVVAEDVVDVINYITAHGSEPVVKDGKPAKDFYDVTGDDWVAADDVLTIINFINAHPTAQQEAGAITDLSATNDALFTLLATDTAAQSKRRKI
jgi:hypothetical protein